MIKTYTNASDAADSARASALQAMVDERFAEEDAARMRWLDAHCAKDRNVWRNRKGQAA
jgi:hypothetical protein